MSFCKSGQILNYCHPNALMTLTEYLADYATPETRALGNRLVEEELLKIPSESVRQVCRENIGKILDGTGNDFRF